MRIDTIDSDLTATGWPHDKLVESSLSDPLADADGSSKSVSEQANDWTSAAPEDDTIAGDVSTTATLSIGGSVSSAVDFGGDKDWFAVTLQAGQTYTFTTAGGATSPSVGDTLMTFHDASGTLLATNDDINYPSITYSQITYTPTTSGTYFVGIGGYDNNYTGSYSLTATQQAAPDPLDAITWNYTVPTNVINVYFAPGGLTWSDNLRTLTTGNWSQEGIDKAMEAFEAFENITNLQFQVVTNAAQADFTMVSSASSNINGLLGYWNVGGGNMSLGGTTYALDGAGVFNSNYWAPGDLEVGGFDYITLIHEIGHGLGLAHPHDNGGGSTIMSGVTSSFGSYGDYNLNQGINTMMSYNDGWQTAPHGLTTSDDYGYEGTPMALDIAVLIEKYGANTTYNNGNNTYTLPGVNAIGTYYSSIYDTGGVDSIVYDGALAVTIDLRPATLDYSETGGGPVSYATGIHGGFTIANGVVIENARGGSGQDTLIGNEANNVLNGGADADQMRGGLGNDTYYVDNVGDIVVEKIGEGSDTVYSSLSYTLTDNVEALRLLGSGNLSATGNAMNNWIVGNDGNNILDGKTGVDRMFGGKGNDTYYVDRIGDIVTENAGEGSDTVYTSVNYTLTDNVEVLRLLGTANLSATGNALSNWMVGNDGNNIIDGKTGADRMFGGKGNDTYYVDHSGDIVTENASEGTDTVYSSINYTLTDNVEVLRLTGTGNLSGTGNALNNRLFGNDGNNILNGGLGGDTMSGGKGNDAYYVDNTRDVVTENVGEGTDTVYSSINYTLTDNVEDLRLLGTASLAGTGNSLNNRLVGNDGNNTLSGGLGNDTLTGGGGRDFFDFKDAIVPRNIDLITDFVAVDDTIRLSKAVFTAFSSVAIGSAISGGALHVGTAAADDADRIIYNQTTGALLYDADGVGGTGAIQFATLGSTSHPSITNLDFVIIA